MLWHKTIGASAAAPLSGVVLVDIQAVVAGGSTSLDLGVYQPDRVLVFGCYIRTSPVNGTPSELLVDGVALTKTGSNASGAAGYLYGISSSLTGTSCTFEPTATSTINGYLVAVWAVYGVLAGSFSATAQSESGSATTRSASVSTAGDLLFALAIGGQSTLALAMGTNGVVDTTIASWTPNGGSLLYYLAGHRDPSSTATVTATQSTTGVLLLYIASAT